MMPPTAALRELPRIYLLKLSEKSRTGLQCSLTGHRNGTFWSILASVYQPNLRLERCSYPFRTVSLGTSVNSRRFPHDGFLSPSRCSAFFLRTSISGCALRAERQEHQHGPENDAPAKRDRAAEHLHQTAVSNHHGR